MFGGVWGKGRMVQRGWGSTCRVWALSCWTFADMLESSRGCGGGGSLEGDE